MTELKPCPFCDGAASYIIENNYFIAKCLICGARGKPIEIKTPAKRLEMLKALRAWNERTGDK